MTDLVIGGRRTTPRRTVRGIAIATLVVLVGLLVAYIIYRRVVSYAEPDGSVPNLPLVVVDDGPDQPRLGFGDSSLAHAGPITVLRLVGKPHTMGAAQGRLLGSAVTEVSQQIRPCIEQTVSSGGLLGGTTHSARLRWRYRLLDDGIPGHQLIEIAGVLRGTRRTAGSAPGYESFVRDQAVLDLGIATPWSDNAYFRAVARSLTFVTALRGPSGDRLLVGRSFGLPGLADGGAAAAAHPVVSFVHPDGVIAYASVGWPGLVGVVSGVNAEGIAVMVHPARTDDVKTTREAQPVPLIARDVLENARTLDDAIAILEHSSPLGAAAFTVVDGNARTWAVVDRSPERGAVTRDRTPPVITDLLDSDPFADDPENDRARRVRPSALRAQRVAQLLRQPPEDPAGAAAILRDTRAVGNLPLPAGHRAAAEDLAAVHTAIFDTSAMVLWVAEGPGARSRFRAFDLRHELSGEGARAAPPPDIPALGEGDGRVAAAVLAAEADLRAARQAVRRGGRRQARELVSRALVRAPDLPQALWMAAELARADHDDERARRLLQRYLDVGPDDLNAGEEARAILDR